MIRCGFPEPHVLDNMPMARGWAYIAWAIENEAWLAVERISDGYIAQEINKRTQTRP